MDNTLVEMLIKAFGLIFFGGLGALSLFWPDRVHRYFDRNNKKGWRISTLELRILGAMMLFCFFVVLFAVVRDFW